MVLNGEEAIRKAYEAILNHDFEQAIAWFEQAIRLEPKQASYHYKLSITHARSNKLSKAIFHAKEAVRLEPNEEHYLFHLQHLEARRLIVLAETMFEDSPERLWLAATYLEQAAKLDPLSTEALLLLGIAYAKLEEYHLAIRALKELLKLDPEHKIGSRLLEEYQLKWKRFLQ